ncbi:hypothetical protein RvY_03750 [Ramazzottius varieornatus]|uniref:Uncharacterized protein n=1 Tax=Ramazzottius varieornatus TaxID=947166 RepID=A0A1D1UPZ0_RAMVA|nr:hypothetical protein RvY_03750 [Ramazzottius varieornatus]
MRNGVLKTETSGEGRNRRS